MLSRPARRSFCPVVVAVGQQNFEVFHRGGYALELDEVAGLTSWRRRDAGASGSPTRCRLPARHSSRHPRPLSRTGRTAGSRCSTSNCSPEAGGRHSGPGRPLDAARTKRGPGVEPGEASSRDYPQEVGTTSLPPILRLRSGAAYVSTVRNVREPSPPSVVLHVPSFRPPSQNRVMPIG